MSLCRLACRAVNQGGVILGIVALVVIIVLAFGKQPTDPGTVDLSWPNCNMIPDSTYSSVIIGVSGGLDFHPNPCIGSEATLTHTYGVYANTGDPGFPRIKEKGAGPKACPLNSLVCYSYNYGYQAAEYALKQMELAGVHSPMWWLDVESINSWTFSVAANRADILGMVAALKTQKFFVPNIGIYTASDQWIALVAHWQNGLPLWLGTGATSRQTAAKDCASKSVTGGKIVLTQYTIGKIDYNYVCNSAKLIRRQFF